MNTCFGLYIIWLALDFLNIYLEYFVWPHVKISLLLLFFILLLIIMAFKQFDLALAKFKDYPLWPVRIIKAGKDTRGKPVYTAFCYGSHDEFRLVAANLQVYDPTTVNLSAPASKKAFEELATTPDIYMRLSKTYLALRGNDKSRANGPALALSSSISPIQQKLVATQAELDKTKNDLMDSITQKVSEKLASSDSLKESTELIASQIYDALMIEFNPKFQRIEKSLKGLSNELENLEDRLNRLENKLDSYEQESLLDSLVFHGVRQKTGVDTRSAVLLTINQKMSLPEISTNEVVNVYRLRLNNAATADSTQAVPSAPRVAPIIVKFSSKSVACKVFKAKSKLASSGIFVVESLTKQRRDILNAAKDRFGQRNAWSDRGQILAKPSDGTPIKKK